MTLTVTVHRGTAQIGGTCIEIVHPAGQRLVLDAGRPLDAPDGKTGLLPDSLDLSGLATVLICHSHQDHWGLINDLPRAWPVWTGEASAKLIGITSRLARAPLSRELNCWSSRGSFTIGEFRVTPILTDHSAFDAYMLLIEGAGQRVLYSGDFRRHGRKSVLVDRLMNSPAEPVDLLILEGTNLGTDKPVVAESALEIEFQSLFNRTDGRVFCCWSGQNIDRTVTLYRAALRTGRTLVIDLYTAEVLEAISGGTRLPRPGMDNLKVVITRGLAKHYRDCGREDFVARMAAVGISARAIENSRYVVMLRDGLMHDYVARGVTPIQKDAFVWSMWRGYLDKPSKAVDWCRTSGAEVCHIHTSGHASPADLRAFAASVGARQVIPVHGTNWDTQAVGFTGIVRVADGEPLHV